MRVAKIVAGIDGSPSSRHALRWALEEARRTGATVEAVHVWHYPALAYSGMMTAPMVGHDELEADARSVLDHEVDAVLADATDPPAVNRVVVEGSAAEQLVEQAKDAELLVVGHRGLGGFATLLLGSVAHQCSAHATCPVLVVRDTVHRAA